MSGQVASPCGEGSAVVLTTGPHRAVDPRRGERLAAPGARRVCDVGRGALRVARREQQRVHLAVDGYAETRRSRPVVVTETRYDVVREHAPRARTLQAVRLAGGCAV